MTREFHISKAKRDEFYFQTTIVLTKIVVPAIWLPTLILVLIFLQNNDGLKILLGITALLIVVCTASIIAEKNNAVFESTIILLDEDSVTRTGNNLRTVQIEFNRIAKVIERDNGLVLVDKDIWAWGVFLFGGRHILSNEPGIIFIPSMMGEFDELYSFFIRKKWRSL
jgi:hypothetical protein